MKNTMKHILIAIVALLAVAPAANAQTLDWSRQFGTAGTDEGLGITSDGTYLYVTGAAEGAVETDAQWQALRTALDLELPGDLSAAERKAREKEIDASIRERTLSLEKEGLAAELQGLGIPAAVVQNAAAVAEDPALRERGHMVRVVHAEAGTHWQSGLPAQFSRTPGGVTRAAPLQGQHSFAVFRQLAGMNEAEYERLARLEVTGRGPVASSNVSNQA